VQEAEQHLLRVEEEHLSSRFKDAVAQAEAAEANIARLSARTAELELQVAGEKSQQQQQQQQQRFSDEEVFNSKQVHDLEERLLAVSQESSELRSKGIDLARELEKSSAAGARLSHDATVAADSSVQHISFLESLLSQEKEARTELQTELQAARGALRAADQARDARDLQIQGLRERVKDLEVQVSSSPTRACVRPSIAPSFAPTLRNSAAPAFGDIPPAYLQVLKRIETQGWHTVTWKDGFTMLHWAAAKGHGRLCDHLVALQADVSAQDSFGHSPMHYARQTGHWRTMQTLELLATTPQKQALANSAGPGFEQTGMAITELGSVSDTSDAPDLSDIMDGAGRSSGLPPAYLDVLEQINEVGWSKMEWAQGFTLLHWAAQRDDPVLCSHFLALGADPNQQDSSGRSALDYARECGSSRALAQFETARRSRASYMRTSTPKLLALDT